MRKALLIAAALVMGALPVSAGQEPAPAQSSSALLGALRKAQAPNPYSKLFDTRDALSQAARPEAAKDAAPKKRIVCGMTVIEAPPFHDARMGVTAPKDESVRYVIRAVEPPICNASTPQ
jgi:hypothetical protein